MLSPTPVFSTPEDICPGGASPRADISWCSGYDNLTHCTTGIEALCASDNGVTISSVNTKQMKILTCPKTSPITTSTGCIYGSGAAGGTSPGYANITPTQTGSESACIRYYVLFGDGWMQNASNTGDHAPALQYTDGSGCGGDITFDFTLSEPKVQVETSGTSCGGTNPTSTNFPYTGTNWTPKNNQWYRIDYCATLNTTASSPSVGNGIITMKIDGVTLVSTSAANMRGVSTTAKFKNAYVARSYFGFGIPRWEPNLYFAAAAYSNNGTEIGASPNQASIASGDTTSPYFLNVASDGAEQKKLALDCSSPGSASKFVTTSWDQDWKDGKTYVTTPDHNQYPCNAECAACTTTNSMQASTSSPSHGAGIYRLPSNLNSTYNHVAVNHGWIYLPSTNDYSTTVPLSGFARYCLGAGGGSDRCWFGIARVGGNAAIVYGTDNVAGTGILTSTAWSTDAWHEYQIAIGTDNKAYLQFDGSWIIDGTTPSQAVGTWAFDDVSTGGQYIIHGIIRDSPATTFTIYLDDMDAGGASFNDNKFWGTSSPFGTPTPTPTPTPSPTPTDTPTPTPTLTPIPTVGGTHLRARIR